MWSRQESIYISSKSLNRPSESLARSYAAGDRRIPMINNLWDQRSFDKSL
jgi:hypothetical protein